MKQRKDPGKDEDTDRLRYRRNKGFLPEQCFGKYEAAKQIHQQPSS